VKRIVTATAMSLCVVPLAAVSADTLILRDRTRVPGKVPSLQAER